MKKIIKWLFEEILHGLVENPIFAHLIALSGLAFFLDAFTIQIKPLYHLIHGSQEPTFLRPYIDFIFGSILLATGVGALKSARELKNKPSRTTILDRDTPSNPPKPQKPAIQQSGKNTAITKHEVIPPKNDKGGEVIFEYERQERGRIKKRS